jgi:hypothetical protein
MLELSAEIMGTSAVPKKMIPVEGYDNWEIVDLNSKHVLHKMPSAGLSRRSLNASTMISSFMLMT